MRIRGRNGKAGRGVVHWLDGGVVGGSVSNINE